MHINNLPNDILIPIFKHICYIEAYTLNQWKNKLIFLSICGRWRALMTPMVYAHVSIFSTGWDDIFYKNTTDNAIQGPEYGTVITNATLLSEVGGSHLAKNMYISVDCMLKLFSSMSAALTTLESSAQKWTGVKSLSVRFNHNFKAPRIYGSNVVDESNINKTVNRLSNLLPSLTKIEFKGVGQHINVCALIGGLAKNYTQQLTHIVSDVRLTGMCTQKFSKLKHLEINFESITEYQPVITSSKKLEYLNFQEITHNDFWTCFADNDTSRTIEFSNLKTLILSYKIPPNAAREILHFPNLQNLDVFSVNGINTVFDHGIFPQTIKYLRLQGSIESIELLSKSKLPRTRRLEMSLGYHPSELLIDSFATINRITSKADQANVRLISKNRLDSNALGDIDCPALTTLVLFAPINAEILLKLINKLPNIYYLSISKLQHAAILDSDDFFNPDDSSHYQAKPLSSSMKHLILRFTEGEIEIEKTILFAKYLLLRLPALKTLNAGQLPGTSIREFAKRQAAAYPFLAKTYFILKGRIGV